MDNMDDFEFENFIDGSNSNFERKIEDFIQSMMEKAIEANYENITKNGISNWHLQQMDDIEIGDIRMTLEKMIKYYEDLEMYERCAIIVKHLRNVLEFAFNEQD